MTKLALHWQIIIAMALAALVSSIFTQESALFGVSLYAVCDFLGQMFLNALKMLIVPLVLSSIICGVANIGDNDNLGRLGAKTMGFYAFSSTIAILTGLVLVNLFKPGMIDGESAGNLLNLTNSSNELDALVDKVEGRTVGDIAEVFLRMVPTNIVDAAANGQMLGLIFFGILFGYFMTKIPSQNFSNLKLFWEGVFNVMMHITLWVMKFAPIGVFALITKILLTTGFEAFKPLLVFFFTVLIALMIHMLFTLSLVLRFVAKVNPLKFFKAMTPVILTAFSTASSSATLPLTMRTVEDDVGVSSQTSSFVLPLGATINMDGTALYECVAAMFIAQAYGLELSFMQQFLIVFTALITSIGVAGIPAASLVAITVILGVIGLPLEGLGLLLVTDRVLDMVRTAVNVYSDASATLVIAHSEGETTKLSLESK